MCLTRTDSNRARVELRRITITTRWLGWTLLVALFVSWVLGLFLITATGADNTGAAVIAVVAAVISIPAAIYLRLYWPPARDWHSRA